MAKAKLNPILESVRGTIGDMVLKQYGSRLVISRKPVWRNRTFSEAQRAEQAKFREAARYAKRLMADPRAREVYEDKARLQGKLVRSLIISDFLNSPSIMKEGSASSG